MLTPVTEADLRTTFFSEICYLYIAAHGQNKTISDTIMDVLNSVWGTTDLESEVDQDSLIDGLNDIQQRDDVDVFWSCHREPTDKIKENYINKLIELHNNFDLIQLK